MALRQFRYWLVNYRRTWRGSTYSSVLNPVLYLGSIGLGLGTLVNKHGTAQLGGVSYLAFLAPGLLAATGDADRDRRVHLPGARLGQVAAHLRGRGRPRRCARGTCCTGTCCSPPCGWP